MRSNKRVLLCPSAYYPSFGGVEEICRNLANELQQLGISVAIAVNKWPSDAEPFELMWDVPVHRFDLASPSRARPLAWHMIPAVSQFHRFVADWNPDLVHVICPTTNSAYLWLLQLLKRRRLLLTFQGELFMDSTNIFGRSSYARWCLRQLLTVTDGITACSKYVLKDANDRFVLPAVQKKVVFNGVSLDEPATPTILHRPYVLGTGRLVKNKGFDFLIEGFASIANEFPQHDLVLAGDGNYRSALEDRARDLGVAERVKFMGRVGREEISGLYAGCAFFVLPSPVEPFGIVCLEAMRAGKPVVATNTGGPVEFIRDSRDGLLVPPQDSQALAVAMRTLLSDPAACARLGASALASVQNFSWKQITADYVHMYDQLLGGSISS